MSVCQGCGAPIPPSRGGPQRKWCSEKCRKTQYDIRENCIDCGQPTSSSVRNGRMAVPRCVRCAAIAGVAPRRALVERMWADGYKMREIRARVGYELNFSALRACGWNLPHRNRVGPLELRLANLERARAAKAASR